jgi:hypothetical protein
VVSGGTPAEVKDTKGGHVPIKKLLFWFFPVLTLAILSCAKRQHEIVGVWKGEMNELPAVELNVQETERQLAGTITFFFQRKDSGTWKVERQDTQPLTRMAFDGKTLLFEVSHEQAHPDSSGDPPVAFTFSLSSSQEGQLQSNYQGQESNIRLVRAR